MHTDIIDVKVAEDQIVACPNCGQRNRVQKQGSHVSFRCGSCRTKLPNPFALGPRFARTVSSFARGSGSSKRRIVVGLFAILVLVLVVFISSPSSTPTQNLPRYQQVQPIQPVVPLPPPRRLDNGTVITELSRIGNGTLTIDNGTGHDAVIKVVNEQARRTVVTFYVCSGQTARVEHIPDGDFRVIFGSGSDWDSSVGTFTREKSFAKFDRELDFVTAQRTQGDDVYSQYSVFTLTLHRVVHGNATTTNVGEEEFLKY